MNTFRLSLVASAVLAGCAVSPPDNSYAYRPGYGVVENVRAARVAIPGGNVAGSAAAHGRADTPLGRMMQPRWTEGYQLALRMDDGTTQAITQDSDAFRAGERVQVTSEGRVLRLPAGAAAAPLALRPGGGTIQSVTAASVAPAAAAGSTAAVTSPVQQVTVTMDDGTTQVLMLQGASFRPGERISISADGRVLRP